MTITIYTDGGARGNPGPAGIGAVILDEHKKVLKEISRYIGETTNNIAEYEALIAGLEGAVELFGESIREIPIEVNMDSELLVRQMLGEYKVKHPALKEKFASVENLRNIHGLQLRFAHVRREYNTLADTLVNNAIDAHEKGKRS